MSSDEEMAEHESSQESAEESQNEGQDKLTFTSFLFGNVNEKGELDIDFLDSVSFSIFLILF